MKPPGLPGWVVTHVGILLCVLRYPVTGCEVNFDYTVGDYVFHESVCPDGEGADFGSYRFGCLGNLGLCSTGLTLRFWFKPLPIEPNGREIILLSNGGHLAFSEGIFMTRQFNDQFTIGISQGDKTWRDDFRLLIKGWTHIAVTWEVNQGLKTYIDGFLRGSDPSGSERYYTQPAFDLFGHFLVGGWSVDGSDNPGVTFSIANVTVTEEVLVETDIKDKLNEYPLLYIGCEETLTLDITNSIALEEPQTATRDCRVHCQAEGFHIAQIDGLLQCSCSNSNSDSVNLLSECTEIDQVKVFYVTHLATHDNFTVSVAITGTTGNADINTLETCVLDVTSSPVTFGAVEVSFGDGTRIWTDQNSFTHSWSSAGTYEVHVTALFGLINKTVSQPVEVVELTEIILPEHVSILPDLEDEPGKVSVQVLVVDNEPTDCQVNFGDGPILPVHFSDYIEIITVQHTYQSLGKYDLHVQCNNSVGDVQESSTVITRGFDLESDYHKLGQSLVIETIGDVSFLDSLLVELNNQSIDFTSTNDQLIIGDTKFPEPGDYLLTVVSDTGVPIVSRVLYVQGELSKPSFTSSSVGVVPGVPQNYTVSIPPGEHFHACVTFGTNGFNCWYIDMMQHTLPVSLSATYDSTGSYPNFVEIANDVSFQRDEATEVIDHPIVDIQVNATPSTSLREGIHFAVDLNMKNNPPQRANFQIDYGDGNSESIDHANLNSEDFEVFLRQHIYEDWGIYNISVTASNTLGSASDWVVVQLGNNIAYLDITTETVRVAVGGPVIIDFFVPKGSDITYVIDLGDGTNLVIPKHAFTTPLAEVSEDYTVFTGSGNKSLTAISAVPSTDTPAVVSYHTPDNVTKLKLESSNILQISHQYSIAGHYTVSGKARNVFNEASFTLCSPVVVSDPPDALSPTCELPAIRFSNLDSDTIVRMRSEATVIQVDPGLNCSVNIPATFTWKATKVATKKGVTTERSYKKICHFQQADNTLILPERSLKVGQYRLTVTVSPNGLDLTYSTDSVLLNIIPSPPVASLGITPTKVTYIYGDTVLDMSSSKDPDLASHLSQYSGLEFELFCCLLSQQKDITAKSHWSLRTQSEITKTGTLFPNTTENPVRLYDSCGCFADDINPEFNEGSVRFPSDQFSGKAVEFIFRLFVCKDDRCSDVTQEIHVQSSNDSTKYDKLGDLLTSGDTDGALQLIGLLSTDLNSLDEGEGDSEDREKEATAKRSFLITALSTVSANLTNIDQVESTANALESVTRAKSQVTQDSRKSASSTMDNVARGLGGSGREQSLDKVSMVGQGIVGSLSNLLPEEKSDRSVFAQALESRRRRRSVDAVDEPEPTEEEIKCDIIKGAIGDSPAGCSEVYMRLIDFFFPKDMDKFQELIDNDVDDIRDIILPELEDEKRKEEQNKLDADREVAKSGMAAVDNVANLFLDKMDENGTVSISSGKISVSVQKLKANTSGNATIQSGSGPYVIPTALFASAGPNSSIGTKVVNSAVNQFTFGQGSSDITGGVVSLTLTDDSGMDLEVRDSDEPFEIMLQADPKATAEMTYHTIVLNKDVPAINYHAIQVTNADASLHVELQTTDEFDQFSVYISYMGFPNETHHDYKDVIPRDKEKVMENLAKPCYDESLLQRIIYPPRDITRRNGTYRVGVKLLGAKIKVSSIPSNHTYGIRIFTSGCRFWNVTTEAWETGGCEVGQCTNHSTTQCLCNHLTSFGGNFVVPPNTIDFNTVWSKFANLHENAAVFATVISILILYILLLIWGRYMDKKDVHKWGAVPLEDNLPSDTYHYQLSVHTGVKKSAGTDSRVSFILSGDDNDTGVRCLFDGKRKHLGRGTIMNYVLSVESGLGPLTFLRIWHDNSGRGKQKGWYLDQVEVIDLQTAERFFFLCDRWLAVEEDDGQVERILPVAGLNDLVAFKHLFSSNVRKKLSNEHLWFSVFSRPTRSKFTRCQRISCCLSLLFLTMITSAMWFKTEENHGEVTALTVGPFKFTLQQVFISFASTMIVFPVSFLLITIFRKSRAKKNTVIQTNQMTTKKSQKYRWRSVTNVPSTWGIVEKSKKDKFKESMRNIISFHNRKYESEAVAAAMEEEELQKYGRKKKKKPMTCPHWTIYIGWILVFLSVTTSAFFTILYSMEWGAEKANDWLVTFLMSFFQSVVVVQPVKVLLMVAFVACILKKPEINEEEGMDEEFNPNHDEDVLSKSPESITAIMLQRKMAAQELQPPDMAALEEARDLRLKEMKMEVIIKELIIYAFFVLVLFFISYQTRDTQSYQYASHLRNMFKFSSSGGVSFEKVNTAEDYWQWAEHVILPQMYAMEWLNGSRLAWWDRRCINDFESRRVGIARLRQLRVNDDTCRVASGMDVIFHDCRSAYSWTADDTKTYLPQWKPIEDDNDTDTETSVKKPGWDYQSSIELKNAPYSGNLAMYKGGGYVVNFERTKARTIKLIQELRENNWIDVRTRAVFLEFTVYNPNVNLFTSITMLTEFADTGGASSRSDFKVFRLFSYVGAFGTVVLLFEIIYACFTLYFLIHGIKKLRKEKCAYFRSFWNILEFLLLAFSVACIVMYAFKHLLTSLAVDELHDAGSADFVNFNSLALYDELFVYMVGCAVFLATIQFLKMLQFNQRMNMLGDTIRLATKDLKNFSVMFIIYFLAFTQAAFLLFGTSLATYGNFMTSIESMFAFCLGSFDFEAMQSSQPILGPAFFFLFVLVVYIGLMGMFVTIIYDSFATVKEDVTLRSNEHEIVDFMWKRFKALIKG